jgi:hypothetical protein
MYRDVCLTSRWERERAVGQRGEGAREREGGGEREGAREKHRFKQQITSSSSSLFLASSFFLPNTSFHFFLKEKVQIIFTKKNDDFLLK